ncbi:precorrin-8X methylmutase [Pseudomonas syringae]|nr:precorrin-8X methylmutase [Pseudomonas syringae]
MRVIHACGMVEVIEDLRFSPGAGAAGRNALAAGAPILCDARMVSEGITAPVCPPITRSSAPCMMKAYGNGSGAGQYAFCGGARVVASAPEGSVVVIGNAPTALFYLLEMLDAGAPKPALILGFPVGFVGAAESKAMLAADSRGVPFVIMQGRRGGSAMAVAAVNALATEIE